MSYTKRQARIIQILFILAFGGGGIGGGIIYPLIKTYYFEPRRWVKECVYSGLKEGPQIDSNAVVKFCECTLEKYLKKYKIDDIPARKDYTIHDYYRIVECTIEYLIADSLKQRARDSIDVVVRIQMEKDKKVVGALHGNFAAPSQPKR
ncbi:MAG: hypothetical protein HYY40_11280 [Bacteroidetes bacterium]|nr:hypothetical protein [Bacteroidota bacterium]